MRLLLDTHLLLWALGDPDRLDHGTRTLIEDTGNDVLFSAAASSRCWSDHRRRMPPLATQHRYRGEVRDLAQPYSGTS